MIETLINMASSSEVNLVNATLRLVLSMFLGAVIGIERMKKGQTAGMRTFSLIATGATIAMLVSIYIPQELMMVKNGDPGRIAAQVVSGIGFLGAGAIIQMKGSVRGLTTAAGIWITAMIGLAVGSGMYAIGCITTAFIIFILVIMDRYEHYTNIGDESKIVRIKVRGILTEEETLASIFKKGNVHVRDVFVKYEYDNDLTILNIMIRSKNATSFVPIFEEIRKSYDTISITLSNEVNVS